MRSQAVGKTYLAAILLVLCSCGSSEESINVPLQAETGPALRLTFNGQTAWFGLDTGASAHTLASWFVDEAELEVENDTGTGDRVVDATGASVDTRVLHGAVAFLSSGDSLVLGSAIVADFPPELEEEGVGGLVSPQLLPSDGLAVVLDLRVPELRIEERGQALQRLRARPISDAEVRFCREEDAPVSNLAYAILVAAGNASGWLGLDTGSDETSVWAASELVADIECQPGGETMGIAGRPSPYSVAPGLELSFAGTRTRVDAQVSQADPGNCSPDGRLGLDALQQCALVLSHGTLAVACED